MRDKRYIAVHRGGPLTKEHHYLLMKWACDCAEHVLHLFGEPIDERLVNALRIAKEWAKGNATVGDARKAAMGAIYAARESTNPVSIMIARGVGHAVATAHMADHALGPAYYALKAVKLSGGSVEAERQWQDEHLPEEVRELILTTEKRQTWKTDTK